MSSTPDLASALDSFIDARLSAVNTSIPGRVVSYDSSTQEVEVLPLIRREVETEDGTVTEALPVVPGVPVIFPGAGAYKITFPVAKGDVVMLLFSQASLDKWLQNGEEVDPADDRRFDMSDAVAIPGLLSFNNATTQVDSSAMVISAPEIKLGSKNASEKLLLGDSYKSADETFADAINTVIAGTLAPAPIKAAFVTAVATYKAALALSISTKVNTD